MRFHTRTQEVEAIQWTGMNDGALHELKPGVHIPSGSFRIQPGYWLVVSEYDGYDWLHPDEFAMRYEPVPGLIRTVADYEGLPDGTILEVVEVEDEDNSTWEVGQLVRRRLGFITNGERTTGLSLMTAEGIVCSVVRLGSES